MGRRLLAGGGPVPAFPVGGVAGRLARPLSHVRRIEAMQRDKARTSVVIAGATGITAMLAYLVFRQTGGTGANCDYTGVTHPFPGCDDPRPGH